MKINHIGIVVRDIEKSKQLYIKMGYSIMTEIIDDCNQNNRIIFLRLNDYPPIELIEPLNSTSSVYNFSPGYHHICYEKDNEQDIIQLYRDIKVGRIFTEPIVAPALDNKKVVFACMRDGSFVELII